MCFFIQFKTKKPIQAVMGKSNLGILLLFMTLCMLFAVPAVAAKDDRSSPVQANFSTPNANKELLFSDSIDFAERNTQAISNKVKRSRKVNLNPSQLRRASGTGLNNRLVLNLFDDTVLVATKDREKRNASGSVTWIGHIEGVKRSSVILVVRDNMMTAKVASPGGIYEVAMENDGTYAITQLEQSRFIDHGSEVPEVVAEPGKSRAFEPLSDIAADDGSVLDVLVVYTPQARVAAGGVAAIESDIELAVAETNLAYEFSDVGQRLDLVHMYESPDAQLPGSGQISAFDTNLLGVRLTADGYIDGVHALRDEYHADFVQLIITDPDYCGLAYLQATPADSGFEDWAFGVTDQSCITGYFSFGHELGHNMGLRHDWYVDASMTPYTWAHGFTNPTDEWRTVMAYNSHCSALSKNCERLAYFSNPGNDIGGDPMGVSGGTASNCVGGTLSPDPNNCDAANHSVLNSNALTNSRFRESKNTWLGGSTNWNDQANWTIDEGASGSTTVVSRVPRLIDDVRIPATPTGGNFPVISTGTHNARNVVIETGATLTMTGGILNVRGNWEEEVSGSFNGSAGSVVFMGGFDQSIKVNNVSVFSNLTFGDGVSTQAISLLSDLDVNGNFTLLNGATFSAGTHIIEVAGNWDDQAGGFSPGTSTVIFDGTNQTVDKLTTQVLLDEPFEEADGVGCGCSSGYLPSGWNREQAVGTNGFLGGELGGSGAAVRWDDSADAWLHTSSISMRADASYEIEYKYRSLYGGTTHDFSVSVGTAQSSGSMGGAAVSTVTDAGNTSYITKTDNFTVTSDGTYYLGFRSQQHSGSGYALIDEVVLSEVSPMSFYNLQIASSLGTVINQDLVVNDNLTIISSGILDLNSKGITVEGALNNYGTLKQTQDVPSGIATEFLRIKNAAGDTDKYFGTVITPSSGSMGSTTVTILGTGGTDWVQRSYEITPTTSQTAFTRFYYRLLDQNGQVNPKVYHWNGSSWDDLGVAASGGSGDGMYVEATTDSYSPFALSDDTPTHASIGKVSLSHVSVGDALKILVQESNAPELLLDLLASMSPKLVDSLTDADTDRLLVALARELDPDGDGLVVLLAWETLEERGTIGFYAERQADDKSWKRLNNRMLPSIIVAPMGAEYLLFDPEAGQLPEYLYRLIEVEAWGTKVQHGPWLLRLK